MTFYLCQNQNILLNLNYIESIALSQNEDAYEARAYTPEGLFYLLETFDDLDEAEKFLEYILSESKA